VLRAYLADEIAPSFARLGFNSEIIDNPVRGGPVLIAERREPGAAATVFGYGHGDVIRGLEPQWREGLSPWELQRQGERLYGRGRDVEDFITLTLGRGVGLGIDAEARALFLAGNASRVFRLSLPDIASSPPTRPAA